MSPDLVRQKVSSLAAAGTPPAAFIAEPLSGNAGGVELPPGYLRGVYEAVRGVGGLCISDEVQVGYGRLGSHFWGFEEHGVVPDILTMAKAAGNGHPLGG
jgi:4-aminobutyrate aminotransferase-like enzyme